ncbi:hypothetical protein I6A84_31415 [Frankia sp. CNm7]|uniref:Uncharacterized protein n=1 Tax=Frankia nepalensis TaxID=1836974 RepID=A0A937RD98_9ACTN|nr:hypothetical protein [Frankia nepalensis]MBL7497083.1 hypothetical protein [Frankia nepalensis]MBL7510754.1 hypothetical protein [Frankia nepalensis]MBL7522472.1 hypothetical protein [Frankia nepalensis]MBL7626764.1 hypothetical protein [Frankia nepalensis]
MRGRDRHQQPDSAPESADERTTRIRQNISASANVAAEVLVTVDFDELGTAEQIAYAQALATVAMVGRLDQIMWQMEQMEPSPPKVTEDLMDRLDQMAQELRWIRDTTVGQRAESSSRWRNSPSVVRQPGPRDEPDRAEVCQTCLAPHDQPVRDG